MRKNNKAQIASAPTRPFSGIGFPNSSTWVGSWMGVLGCSTQTQLAHSQQNVQFEESETSPAQHLQQGASRTGDSQRCSATDCTPPRVRSGHISESTDKIVFFPSPSTALHAASRQFDASVKDTHIDNAHEDLAKDLPSEDASTALNSNGARETSTAERQIQFADLWIALFEFERLNRSNKEEETAA